jgi:transposase
MDERLRFVAKLLDGETMTEACREFGISRKTGYKIFNRYKESGFEALTDRSRRPVRYANQLAPQLESLIVTLKREKPHWGARKIRELLVRRLDGDVRIPAKSTIHAVLHRNDLVKGIRRVRHRPTGTTLSCAASQRPLVRRFQGRVQAGQRSVLLSADGHRPGLALPVDVRGSGFRPRSHRHYRLRTTLPRARLAPLDPLGQRRALRQPQRPVQPLQDVGLVATAGHLDRAHPTRPAAAKRPP